MDFRVLGPLEVVGPAGAVTIRAAKLRLLLSVLLLRVNNTVGVDELIDVLWADDPPRTAAKTLQTYVSQLRQLLDAHDRIVTRPTGYALVAEPDEVDALVFERDAAAGRNAILRGDPASAARLLGRALGLWRSRAFEDLDDRGVATAEAARLESLRLDAIEDHVEARLALGAERDLVAELEQHVTAHPLRERLWAHLMRALYRSGRQADALRAYQHARQILTTELGIEPGPELQRLERAVLDQDTALDGTSDRGSRTRAPTTEYARTHDGVSVAFKTYGRGERDVVFVPAAVSHVEASWEDPELAPFYRRLSDFGRLIVFDKRGTGMSDPVSLSDPPKLDDMVDDVLAVMDSAASERATLYGLADGGAVAALFAAAHPERVTSLVLYNSAARYIKADDYPYGLHRDVYDAFLQVLGAHWGTGIMVPFLFPDRVGDLALRDRVGRMERLSASPALALAVQRLASEVDIRAALPTIRVPTLVMVDETRAEWMVPLAEYLVANIPDARLARIDPGTALGHASTAALDELEKFLTGQPLTQDADCVLATVLFVDVVDSAAGGLPESYTRLVRRQLDRFRGVAFKAPGAGTLATFDAPGRAIACARAITDGVRALGMQARAGLHAGEIEARDGGITGVAVTLAKGACALARPDEVLASQTVIDLVTGSAIEFCDRGEHQLEGVPGSWRLAAVRGP